MTAKALPPTLSREEKRLVELAVVEKKLVVVALVVVLLIAVKLVRVEEALETNPLVKCQERLSEAEEEAL